MFLQLLVLCTTLGAVFGDIARTNMVPGRSTIVHLFEWKWNDIADECERFLGRHGYGGVQVSPPSENLIVHLDDGTRPWYERYQVMSYKLLTRSGNEEEFAKMTRRCNNVGVRIYVDVVINHMTANNKENVGTAGSTADFAKNQYFAVPYRPEHFHADCTIHNYEDPVESRNCQLVGLKDLNQTQEYVQNKIDEHFNHLVQLGVAGFRVFEGGDYEYDTHFGIQAWTYYTNRTDYFENLVDAAKHMWPADLKKIYDKVDNLNTDHGFEPNSRPYIYQEVIYNGNGNIKHSEYTPLGDVTEFRVGTELKRCFSGDNSLKWLVSWGEAWNLSPSDKVLVFIDNHDSQRNDDVLTFKKSRAYKAATAFMLAHPYGSPKVMSSFAFDKTSQGPPHDASENILSPSINQDDTCGNGWICEHRWRQIYQMITFRNIANDTKVNNWWDNGNNQIAFSRGNKGFIAFNIEGRDLNQKLQTGLPEGEYCDVITGKRNGQCCTGAKVTVGKDGTADIRLPGNVEDMVLAIHVGPQSSLLQHSDSAERKWNVGRREQQ